MASRKPKPKPKAQPKPRREVSRIITGPCAKTPESQAIARSILGKRW